MRRAALAFALTIISVSASYGQSPSELIPLEKYLDLPADRRVPTYPLIRCAGMHSGLLTYGAANSAPDKGRLQEMTAYVLAMAATVIHVDKKEGTVDEISQDVQGSVGRVSKLYVQRLKDNYARDGQAFGADPLVKSDLQLCKVIAEAVAAQYPEAVAGVKERFPETADSGK